MGIGWDEDLIVHEDGLARCGWCGRDGLYMAYHDDEWAVPERDGRKLFEKFSLDAFQAGLSWLTILRKREGFRAAFAGFDVEKVARFGDSEVERLMGDGRIVRNRAKIEATIGNARAVLEMGGVDEFSRFLWEFTGGRTMVNQPRGRREVPAATPLAEQVSAEMKRRGFRFCGPTIVYAFMQAVGMVDDHLVGCHRKQGARDGNGGGR